MGMSERVTFDVATYPIGSVTETIVVDIDQERLGPDRGAMARHLGHGALRASDSMRPEIGTRQSYSPETTTVISNSSDTTWAIDKGMGVVEIEDVGGLHEALGLLMKTTSDQPFYDHPLYTDFSYADVADTLFKPGETNVVGFVGRTGAGKSTAIRRLVKTIESSGGHASLFEIDAFFKRSRKERKAWLAEAGISEAERADRRRVVTWWDLGRAADTLRRIHDGEHVRLDGLYDMRRGGEMVGAMDINPNENGHTVFVEGTALLLPEFEDVVNSFVYVNAHDHVRAQSLIERNTRDGYTLEESHARKKLTDTAETNEHIAGHLRQGRYRSGNLTVLDNTARGDKLRLMPPYIPRH